MSVKRDLWGGKIFFCPRRRNTRHSSGRNVYRKLGTILLELISERTHRNGVGIRTETIRKSTFLTTENV